MLIRLHKRRLGIEMWIVGSFFFSYYIREIFQPSSLLIVNFLALFGFFQIIVQYGKKYTKKKLTSIVLGVFLTLNVLFILTEIKAGHSFLFLMTHWTALLPPVLLIYLSEVIEESDFKRVFVFFLKGMNIITLLVFVILVTDIFTGKSAMSLFASISGSEQLKSLIASEENRYCSIIGHFIPTGHLYIYFYLFNTIANRLNIRKYSSVITTLIAIIGVSFSVSKASIVALLILIILFNISSIKGVVGSVLGTLALYYAGVFELIMRRFISTDLTSGRYEMWLYVSTHLSDLFPIWIGHGAGSIFELRESTNMIAITAAFEYPIRLFSYELGAVFTALFYLLVFIGPIVIVIKNRNISLTIFLVLTSLLINMYNGIGCYLDAFWQYSIYVFLIIGLSRFYKSQEIFKFIQTKKMS